MKNYLIESMNSYMGKLNESTSTLHEVKRAEKKVAEINDTMVHVKMKHDNKKKNESLSLKEAKEKHANRNKNESLSLKEDYNPQLNSDVYNALADIMFEYYKKGIKITPEQMQAAFEWFDVHFWADEDLDEACNSESKKELKEDINTPFIKIYRASPAIKAVLNTMHNFDDVSDDWDFPIEELDYLLEEHPGESFVLQDDRLYEIHPEEMNESLSLKHKGYRRR